jgi:hypothetical protein
VVRGQVAIVEERNRATSGEATELHERLSDVREGADRACATVERRAGRTGDLVADVGAQQAVSRCRASVDVDAATGAEADGVLSAVEGLAVQVVGANTAADAEAGFPIGM